jgi:phage tail protein X
MKRYQNIQQIKNINPNVGSLGTLYYKPNFYPSIPLDINDIYVLTSFEDRLDLLAHQFYGDVELYWIISAANPDVIDFGSLFIEEGTQLRIPVNITDIIGKYNKLNSL